MRCNPVNKLFSSHAESCTNCRNESAIDSLVDSLLKNHAEASPEDFLQNHWDESRLTRRVFARIQEMEEGDASTWESGVIAIRGWLVAFGTAAILLVALSSQLAVKGNSVGSADDTTGQVSRADRISSEDIISRNATSGWASDRESGHESEEDRENDR